MQKNKKVLELAKYALDLSDRRCWGLGECRYHVMEHALMDIDECEALSVDDDTCTTGHAEHLDTARKLAREAISKAQELQAIGIYRIN